MPSLNFFAATTDLIQMLDFVFSQPEVTLFEMYSQYDMRLRNFSSTQELLDHYQIGMDQYGNGKQHTFQLWSSLVMPRPNPKRIELTPGAVKGYTFRYAMYGYGLMQLYLGGRYGDGITPSYFGHDTEHRARVSAQRDQTQVDRIDWHEFNKLSGKIQYLLRRKLSPAQASSYLVLNEAYKMYRDGFNLSTGKNARTYNIASELSRGLVRERG